MRSLRCLLGLLLLVASTALAQPAPDQRLNVGERWITQPHTGGAKEQFQLSAISLEPAQTPEGGTAIRADVKAAPLEKAGDAGYMEFRWTAADQEPALDLATTKALRLAYRIEPTDQSAFGVPFLRLAEDWDQLFVGVAGRKPFVADGQWHTTEIPLGPLTRFPADSQAEWNWQVRSVSLNFFLYAQQAGVETGAVMRFGDFRLVPKTAEEIARDQQEAERVKNKLPAYLVLTHDAVSNGPPDLTTSFSSAPNPKLAKLFEGMGFEKGIAGWTPQLSLDYLKRFNLVVILHLPQPGAEPQFDAMIEEKKALLLQYVQEGGGLLVLRSPGWQFGKDIQDYNKWLAPTGVEILSESIVDEEHQYAPEFAWPLYWTGKVTPGPLTQGVEGIFYPPAIGAYTVYTDFTSPVKITPDWEVLLSGMDSAKSLHTAKIGKDAPDTPGTYASAPPMLAVRQYGKGRICVWPIASSCVWQDGYHLRWGGGLNMSGEAEGMRGSAARLLTNLFAYLSEPSQGTCGGYVPPRVEAAPEAGFEPMDWDHLQITGNYMPRNFVGLIGARSSLSTGQGKPEEFIAAAQAAGYDFIAFTEDLASLTKEEFATLQATCKASTDAGYPAYPGYLYLDASGNSWVTFSDRLGYPEEGWFSADQPGRIHVNNPLFRSFLYPPMILIKSHLNPEKPWFQGNFKGFGVYTYENGKLVDDSLDNYLRMAQMRFIPFPAAIHLVDSPEAVAAARQQGFQSYCRWFDDHPLDAYSGDYNKYQGNYVWYRSTYVSEGPVLEDTRIYNFGTTDLALPGLDRFRLHLRASSPVGLQEVALLDGDAPQPWRRFLPAGAKECEQTIDGFHDREYNLVLTATDRAGKRAVGWVNWTQVQENSFPRCSDNFNSMPRGKWFGPSKGMQNCRGIEDYLVGRNFMYCGLPSWEGLTEFARPAVGYYPVLVSRFGTIVDTLVEDHYPPDQGGFNPDRTDYAELAVPNETLAGKVRYTWFTPWQNSSFVQGVRGEFTAKQEAELGRNYVFVTNGLPGALQTAISEPEGVLRATFDKQTNSYTKPLPEHGYAAVFPQPFNGSLGAISLQEGLTAWTFAPSTYGNMRLFREGQQVKAGDKLTYQYLGVTSQFNSPADDSFVSDVVSTLGLGAAPAYQFTPARGEVLSTTYVLRLKAQGYGVAGKITEVELPLQLPVFVEGLQPNWDAAIWYRGKNTLDVPEWVVDEVGQRYVERRRREGQDQLLRFPVRADGEGMLQIDTEVGAKDVYIGNLLVSDNTDLRLTLTDIRPGKAAFVAHNPTDKEIRAQVKPGPGFTLLGDFGKAVTVPAGNSVTVAIR